MELDPLFLSRIQFAFVVSFHAIFPVFTIGLAAYIATLEALSSKHRAIRSTSNCRSFWTKVFAVVFGMGVVSGIVMAFQFGTNWSNFSYASANFLGAGAQLRGGHRLLPRGHVPRRAAVRPRQGAAGHAPVLRLHGGAGHVHLLVLDSLRQQLDADAGRHGAA
jgi:hypothetical protein